MCAMAIIYAPRIWRDDDTGEWLLRSYPDGPGRPVDELLDATDHASALAEARETWASWQSNAAALSEWTV